MPIDTEKQIYYKPLSILVSRMVPDYMIAEYPEFILFMEKYFEYMEQELKQYDVVANLLNYRDIDNTISVFESSFKERFLHSFPESLAADVDLLVKNIRSFYKSRGTEDSYRFLFKALFNTEAEFFYPKTKILKTSDGNWFTPEYLVLTDQNGNTPPQFPSGDSFQLNTLIRKFIFGVTTGTVALVDDIHIQEYHGSSEIHIQILEKEGAFVPEEQIVLGSNIVENGSFSDGTLNWTTDQTDEFITTNLVNELELEQDALDIRDKYIYQLIGVEVNTQYYLRYSLAANKTDLVDSDPRFDSDASRVTVGITPGGNDLFDSGAIGTYVDVDIDSLAAIDTTLKWEPSGASNGIVNLYHINYDLQTDPGSLTPVGAGLTFKNTNRISEFDTTPRDDGFFEGESCDIATDNITFADHGYITGDRVRLDESINTAPTPLVDGEDYWIIYVDDDTIQLAASLVDALSGTQIDITIIGLNAIYLTTPARVHLSVITDEADFIDKTTIHATNGYVFLTPLDDVLTATNFFVWSASATYALHDYVIKDDILYKSTLASNTTDPADEPIINWVIISSLFIDGPTFLGMFSTLKLLPPTNSQQANLYVSVHNEMTVAGQRSTFDGISLVAKDDQDTPLLFIANEGGQSGIVTGIAQFKDTSGFLSSDMKIQDGDYYQEFSYEISSTVGKEEFEQVVRDNLHPAGFKMFANVQTTPTDDSSLLDQTLSIQMVYNLAFPAQYMANASAESVFAGDTDVDPSTDNITVTDHAYTGGMAVRLRGNGNTVPVGLLDNTNYFVIVVDANTIQLAVSVTNATAGTQINITADGSGDISLYKDGINIVTSEVNYHIEEFFNKGLTFAEVEFSREDTEGFPLLADLHQTVSNIPIGFFDARAAETFPWSDSYDVTLGTV